MMRKIVALSHPHNRLNKPIFKLPSGVIHLNQITNEFIDALSSVPALKKTLARYPKRWCFIYGSFFKKKSLDELERMHDLDVMAILKSQEMDVVFNGDNTKRILVMLGGAQLDLNLDYHGFVSKAPYDVDSLGRNWAESLALKVSYNQGKNTVDACLVTFSRDFKEWLEAPHEKPINYHQIPEVLNTNGTYFDVFSRLNRAMKNKGRIEAQRFFLLNKHQLIIDGFKQSKDEFVQNESRSFQHSLALIEKDVSDFLGYYFKRSIIFSHFKHCEEKVRMVRKNINEILIVIEQNSRVPQYERAPFNRRKQDLMIFVRELGPIITKDNVRIISRYFRAAKIDFSQHLLSIDDVPIMDYQTFEDQLENIEIKKVIQFFDQVKSSFFDQRKQKIELSARGLLKILINEIINKKQINSSVVKVPVTNTLPYFKQIEDKQTVGIISEQKKAIQHNKLKSRGRCRKLTQASKKALELKRKSNSEYESMILKCSDDLHAQVCCYRLGMGLIAGTLLFACGDGVVNSFNKNRDNSKIITALSLMTLFLINLFLHWQAVEKAIHVLRYGPTDIKKLKALQQRPLNDESKTMVVKIIQKYFEEDELKALLKPLPTAL